MEKSIETIWKEGFLKHDALVAPKLNDLYNQKSSHIIDKFKRRFKINLIAIVTGSFVVLGLSFSVGIPVMGVLFFLILQVIVIVNKKQLNELKKVDKGKSSYQYLKTFDDWLKKQLSVNRRMARYCYPLFFLSIVLGFWFADNFQIIFSKIIEQHHEIYLIHGIPVVWLILVGLVAALLAIFGGRIYDLDVGVVYGRMLNKLEEMLADMDELRS
uniref:Uncharacterized protein n=1 Tax=Roseihalotalea indica TaxID=2867963 RepID=A0AA49JK49_9BACT|nr:hypothetical protein K4G66_15700 [Tunicatimonas sp. TK19036]